MTLTLFHVWYRLECKLTVSVIHARGGLYVCNRAMLCSAWRAQVIHHNSYTTLDRQTPVKHALHSEHVHQLWNITLPSLLPPSLSLSPLSLSSFPSFLFPPNLYPILPPSLNVLYASCSSSLFSMSYCSQGNQTHPLATVASTSPITALPHWEVIILSFRNSLCSRSTVYSSCFGAWYSANVWMWH